MTTATLAASQGQSLGESSTVHFPSDPKLPGKCFEPRQDNPMGDYTPNPSKSLPVSPARKALVDDIISLYEMGATVERMQRYTPDAVYNDPVGYADDRYRIASQWFGLPYVFREARSRAHEIITNDKDLIQFLHEMEWLPKVVPKIITIRSLVSLSLDPATVDSDFIRVKYHKDQAAAKDYSNEGPGVMLKKWQAEATAGMLSALDSDLRAFASDKGAGRR
ncbi:db95d36a-d626-40ca-90ce-6538db098de4 [Thermothielavioides terrestris]|uniref:Db95d36a-d626-40ca-90ce-6538db098de4 n=1 Tax=Thermothielavioides terrestris TaxID=2587410 RepID=A0A446BS37_9PEZI|nr:db95d36a-d626-40ca-90ce-6538db098de4 [Thermothielavioides terrestris]